MHSLFEAWQNNFPASLSRGDYPGACARDAAPVCSKLFQDVFKWVLLRCRIRNMFALVARASKKNGIEFLASSSTKRTNFFVKPDTISRRANYSNRDNCSEKLQKRFERHRTKYILFLLCAPTHAPRDYLCVASLLFADIETFERLLFNPS